MSTLKNLMTISEGCDISPSDRVFIETVVPKILVRLEAHFEVVIVPGQVEGSYPGIFRFLISMKDGAAEKPWLQVEFSQRKEGLPTGRVTKSLFAYCNVRTDYGMEFREGKRRMTSHWFGGDGLQPLTVDDFGGKPFEYLIARLRDGLVDLQQKKDDQAFSAAHTQTIKSALEGREPDGPILPHKTVSETLTAHIKGRVYPLTLRAVGLQAIKVSSGYKMATPEGPPQGFAEITSCSTEDALPGVGRIRVQGEPGSTHQSVAEKAMTELKRRILDKAEDFNNVHADLLPEEDRLWLFGEHEGRRLREAVSVLFPTVILTRRFHRTSHESSLKITAEVPVEGTPHPGKAEVTFYARRPTIRSNASTYVTAAATKGLYTVVRGSALLLGSEEDLATAQEYFLNLVKASVEERTTQVLHEQERTAERDRHQIRLQKTEAMHARVKARLNAEPMPVGCLDRAIVIKNSHDSAWFWVEVRENYPHGPLRRLFRGDPASEATVPTELVIDFDFGKAEALKDDQKQEVLTGLRRLLNL